jgi:hypothetical protein
MFSFIIANKPSKHMFADLPEEQYTIIQSSIHLMMQDLERAKFQSADVPDASPIEPVGFEHTGRRGRPRIVIDPEVLEVSYGMRGPTELGRIFKVSSHSVRRRAVDLGIVEAGKPVYVDFEEEDGTTRRYYTSSTSSLSTLSDEDLDSIMVDILRSFPSFGRRMIDGHLKFLGHHLPRLRIQKSYARVHGPPISAFGVRRIERRVYNVRGYNSLCHHDGQHGK